MTVTTASLEALRARYGERYKWLVMLTVMVGMVASIMSSTIVNVAIPDLSRHFVIGQERAQWVSAAFMVAMTLSMLLTPWLMQRFGLRKTYLGATLLLMMAGIVGGFATNYPLLIAMRAAEGFSAGVIQPIPNILIMRSFPRNEQGRAMGIFGFGVLLAPAMGPTVGGLLVEYFGWRSIFFVVVPFCLVGIGLGRKLLATGTGASEKDEKPLDWVGLSLVSFATICVLNGLVELHHPSAVQPWVLLGLGALAFPVFIVHQLRARRPMLELRLAARAQVGMGAIVGFLYGFGLFGSTYLLPVYFQEALGYSPSAAGLVMLPAGIALGLAIPVAGRLADRLHPDRLVMFGIVVLGIFTASMALFSPATPFIVTTLCVMFSRIGLGMIATPLSLASVHGLAPEEVSHAVSMTSFMRQFGGSMGVSVVGIVLEWRLRVKGVSLSDPAITAASKANAFDELFIALALTIMLAAIAAWHMKSGRRVVPHG